MSQAKFYRIVVWTLIFCMGIGSVPNNFIASPAYAVNEKITTAIVSIDCPAENDLPARINDMLTTSMVKSHRFEVTDKSEVDAALKSMGLQNSGLNLTQACNVGRNLGVSSVTMVQGYGIESDNTKCYINMSVQVIDIESGIVIQNAFARGEGYKGQKFELTDEAINNAIMTIVDLINFNLSTVGLVAIVKDGNININVGGDIGVKDNAEFVVYRDNKVIGKLKIKGLDSYDCSMERVVVLPGRTIQEGDIVVLASNQGEEIMRNNSPTTIQTASVSPALILTAVLVGTAIAIIAANGSSQVTEAPKNFVTFLPAYRAIVPSSVLVTYPDGREDRESIYIVGVRVLDSNNNPVADGTSCTFIAGTVTTPGTSLYFSPVYPPIGAWQNTAETKTLSGVATVYLSYRWQYNPTTPGSVGSATFKVLSEKHESQFFTFNISQ